MQRRDRCSQPATGWSRPQEPSLNSATPPVRGRALTGSTPASSTLAGSALAISTRRQWLSACGVGLLGLRAAPAAHAISPATKPTSALLLAKDWQPGSDPAGWLVSEKLDGVRALWDGQRLRFRSGRDIAAPANFLQRLPQQPLDGELWLARGRFDELSGLVRRSVPDAAAWASLRFMVFELPDAPGPFAQRAAALQQIVARVGFNQLLALEQSPVADAAALQARLDATVAAGGEGLMLHRADAPYVTGRSELLRKLKPQDDAEAVVIAHQAGRGALAGQTGALRVRSSDGREFDVGTGLAEAQRRTPPAIGTRITYTHRGLTSSGLPRFASYLRLAAAE